MKLIEIEGNVINVDHVEWVSHIDGNNCDVCYFLIHFVSGSKLSVNKSYDDEQQLRAMRELLLQRMYGREIPVIV